MKESTRLSRLLAIATGASFCVLLASPAHAGAVRKKGDAANATAGTAGLGLQLGCPTGVTVKVRLAASSSFQGAGGFGCGADIAATGDYVLEMANFLSDPQTIQLSWYVGVGGRYAYWHGYWGPSGQRHHGNVDLGPRVPVGLEMHFTQMRQLEAFLEIAPGIDFVDDPGVTVDGAIGARFFF